MRSAGFTLIELLVVISIIAILGVAVFINYKDFSQNQVLDEALGQVQTYLRLAQANATSSTLCLVTQLDGTKEEVGGVSWSAKFVDKDRLSLTCGTPDSEQKTQTLEDVEVASIQCSPTSNANCPPDDSTFSPPLTVSFAPLNGNVSFTDSDSCVTSASTLMIILRNQKNDAKKCFTISKGGAIDVQ